MIYVQLSVPVYGNHVTNSFLSHLSLQIKKKNYFQSPLSSIILIKISETTLFFGVFDNTLIIYLNNKNTYNNNKSIYLFQIFIAQNLLKKYLNIKIEKRHILDFDLLTRSIQRSLPAAGAGWGGTSISRPVGSSGTGCIPHRRACAGLSPGRPGASRRRRSHTPPSPAAGIGPPRPVVCLQVTRKHAVLLPRTI